MLKTSQKALAILAVGLGFIACEQPVQKESYPEFTEADAKTAYNAVYQCMGLAMALEKTKEPTKTETGTTLTVVSQDGKTTYSKDVVISATQETTKGKITFDKVEDGKYGYTISGTIIMNSVDSASGDTTLDLTMDMNLSGTGPIRKFFISGSGVISVGSDMPANTVFTINGKKVDPKIFASE